MLARTASELINLVCVSVGGSYQLEGLIFSQRLSVSTEAWSVGLPGHTVVMQPMARVVCLSLSAFQIARLYILSV